METLSGYVTLDCETTTKTSFKRKANAFDPDNWVVYVGWKSQSEDSRTQRFLHPDATRGWLVKLLASRPRMLVTYNGKFDLLHAIAKDADNYKAYKQWVAAGGIVFDCQLAEYCLGGMLPELQMLSLDEVAPRYGGHTKVDEVKAMWEAGIDTPDIPEDLITEYLHGDVNNTEKIFLGQLQRARECGQTKSLLLNMGSLLYTIEAELNGMKVDVELGRKLAAELEAELVLLDAKLHSYLPADLPWAFNWGSGQQKSAFIFGGKVKYTGTEFVLDEQGDQTYYQKKETQYVLADGSTTPDLMAPGIVFYQSGKNAGSPKTKQVTGPDIERGPKTRQCDRYYEFPRLTEPYAGWALATEGAYSTSAAVIEALGERDIPFLKDMARHASLTKDLGTYFITTDKKGDEVGMLTLVQPDGVIHHSLNHTSTVTGRFSSSKPNLQNIPKGGKSKVKQVFVSRFEDGKIIQSDFTALEIYIQAILTGDKQLIADLKAGLDMHCARVATTYKVDYDMVVLAVRAEGVEGFPGEHVWTTRRAKAKVFSFQRAYGAGAALIAASTGMEREEVDALIVAENLRYPGVEEFYSWLGKQVEASKRGIRKTVPHPNFPAKRVELRTGYYRTQDNKLYAYIEQPSPKFVVEREGRWTGFSPTELKNYIVQGEGGEWAKAAMWLAVRAFYHYDNFDGKALLVNQVHDACYADSDKSVAFEAAALLHASMEAASELMETYFGWPIPVHVPSDTKWGANMGEEHTIDGVRERAEYYRTFLRDQYIQPKVKA